MARQRVGPWFNATKGAWYYTVEGRNKSLFIRGKGNGRAAWEAYEAAVAAESGAKTQVIIEPPAIPLSRLVEDFLAATAARLKKNTVRIYGGDLRSFTGWEGMGTKRPNEVRPSHIQAWAAQLKVCDTTRAMSIRSVGAFFGWLVADGVIDVNPVKRVVKPKSRKRGAEAVVDRPTYERLLRAASKEFRNVLRFLWATGCRPGEVSQVTAAAFSGATRTVRVASHKTDRTGHARTLFLDEETAALVAGLAARFPSGPVFRTYKGTVWTGRAITEAMKNTTRKAGLKARAYDFRHTFGTEALLAGTPDAQVAAMMGHSSTATLHASYSHVLSRSRELGEAAEELARKRAG